MDIVYKTIFFFFLVSFWESETDSLKEFQRSYI